MKKISTTFIGILCVCYAGSAQIILGSRTTGDITISQNINFNDPSGTLLLESVVIETTGNITFSNNNIVLNGAKIKCSNLSFTAANTSVQVLNTNNINCANLVLPAPAPATVPLIFNSNGLRAKLFIDYTGTFTNPNNYTIASSPNLSITIK